MWINFIIDLKYKNQKMERDYDYYSKIGTKEKV